MQGVVVSCAVADVNLCATGDMKAIPAPLRLLVAGASCEAALAELDRAAVYSDRVCPGGAFVSECDAFSGERARTVELHHMSLSLAEDVSLVHTGPDKVDRCSDLDGSRRTAIDPHGEPDRCTWWGLG